MARILVFDSGVGGLSILRAIQSHPAILASAGQPHQWLFCSDNAFFPYGTKAEAALVQRVVQVLTALQAACRPDVVVVACNTASTVALAAVRAALPVPVVGVVPAIKPAARVSESRCIGLLATPGTIARAYTQQLIDEFAADCTVVRVGSSELVILVEAHLRGEPVNPAELQPIVAPLQAAIATQQLDTVVLACTHFPLVEEALRAQLPQVKHWVDSGEAIARRVAWCLEQVPPAQPEGDAMDHLAFFTRLDASVEALRPALATFGLDTVRELGVT